ncbi:patatin-like phospholipase family protein [Lutibacter sp. A80]|uniref:patatin-like phospholipase family protein n=1 Tax=Lutibacter sp. A80 TaxID=2918453 RepID=UPI001F060910|nr:patatin-like phospholipase family protein [Lutibacter sp. A80]UMB59332.1 patatin-like phospholipase family protein [Lutibacter sp. A80]
MKKFLSLIFIIISLVGFSQEKPAKQDLKVGLVLSGGGAKGIAHIAVLKVLEEAGVRVDYIGGTSMGAIVGALYASGYTANQLDSIVRVIDFERILTDQTPRKSKPFYEKEIGEKYSLSLPVKNKKVGIPRAMSEGQNVLNLLTKLTQHVNNISDFNKLPIPFVCIATNLETGKQEVLNSGFLPEAVKASGSFPTLLAPVEIDGKILTDGGIVNNFPVDEVKNMGADVIIGVDIQSGLDKKENLGSAVAILNQIVGFQMYTTLESKYKKVDILIKPDVNNYNVVSFDKGKEIMEAGDVASREHINELKAIANQQTHKKNPKIETKQLIYDINNISIEGNVNYTRAYILGKLNFKKQDRTDYNKLIEGINNLYATGNFENIQYKIIDNKNAEGGSTLNLKVKENKVSNYIQFGAHFDDLYKTGIVINSTAKHLLNKNDIFSADLVLGDNIRYNLNYFIDNGFYTSFGIKSRYNSFNSNMNFNQTDGIIDESNINEINLVYEDFTNQIYFQTVFNRRFAIGIGGEYKHVKAFTETLSSLTTSNSVSASRKKRGYFDNSDYLNLIAYLKIDTYDKKYFQKNGVFLDVDFRWYLTSSEYKSDFLPEYLDFESFSQLKGKFGIAHTFFNKLTTHFTSEAGITIGDNDNRAIDYNIGGYGENLINTFIPFYGYDLAELNANSFLKSSLAFRYEFLPKNYLSITANYARVERDLFNGGNIFENTKSGYMVGYGIDTFLGPIEINHTWSPDHSENFWYFNVGYWF